MDSVKSLTRRPWVAVVIFAAFMVGACVPIRLEARWPVLSLTGDEQNIFVTYNDRIAMIEPENGSLVRLRNADGEIRLDEQGNARLWDFRGPQEAPNQFFSSPVVVDETTLLIPTHTERLFEVDLPTARTSNGEGLVLSGQVVSDALWHDDTLYVGEERELVALDVDSGAERWSIETGQSVWSKPMVVDGVMYFTSLDHFLYAVDPQSGDILWQLDLEGAVPETPVYHEGRLYAGGFARKIFEISLDGEIISTYDTENWVWGKPVIVDDTLYAADLSGMVYALNISDGGFDPVWRSKVSERSIRMTPLVSDDYVVVGSRDHHVYWLNREDGSTFFSREVAGEVLSDMLLVEPSETVDIPEPYVIVATLANEDFVVAFSLQNGERAWPNSYTR